MGFQPFSHRNDSSCMCPDCVAGWNSQQPGRVGGYERRDRGRRGSPPIAKNPANQAAVDKLWEEEQERKRKERAERRAQRRGGVGARAVEGIITGVTALSGMSAQPPADMSYQAADAYDQARSSLVENRDDYLDEQTRAANDRKRGSGGRR